MREKEEGRGPSVPGPLLRRLLLLRAKCRWPGLPGPLSKLVSKRRRSDGTSSLSSNDLTKSS